MRRVLRTLPALMLVAAAAPVLAQSSAAEALPDGAAGRQGRAPAPVRGFANPSAVIGAEIALSQLAREKGRWPALRATAAPDAVVSLPALAAALPWLKSRPDGGGPSRWITHAVWSSCDGALAVTSGGWRSGDAVGGYSAVWQRQPDGAWRWLAQVEAPLPVQPPEPDMIAASVAECPVRPVAAQPMRAVGDGPPARPRRLEKPAPLPVDPALREGASPDGTLSWRLSVDADGTRHFAARFRHDGTAHEIAARVAAPAS